MRPLVKLAQTATGQRALDDIDKPASWEPSPIFFKYAIATLLTGAVAFMMVVRLAAPDQTARYIGPAVAALVAATAWLLVSRGKTRAGIYLLAIGTWLAVTGISIFNGGVRTPVIVAYPVLIMMIGWLISQRAAVAVAALTAATTIGLVVAEWSGWLPVQPPTVPAMYGVVQIMVVAISAVLMFFLVRSYQGRLAELAQRTADLKRHQLELNRAQAVGKTGSWVYDIARDSMRLSVETCRIFGLPEGTTGNHDAYLARTHADDRSAIERAWQEALKGATFDQEHRIVVGNKIRWIRQKAAIEFGADGLALRAEGITQDITDLKRAEAEIIAAKNRLQATLDAIPDLLFETSPDGRIHAWHTNRTDLLAAPPEAFMGKLVPEVVPPDAAEAVLSALSEAMAGGRSVGKTYALQLPQGKHWFELSAAAMPEAGDQERRVIVLVRDITRRKQDEETLRQSEARFRLMFEHNDSVMLLIDPACGAIVGANEAAARFYGYSVERLTAMRISQINTLPADEIAARMAAAGVRQRNFFVFPHRLASGELRTVEVRSSVVEVGARSLLFSIIHDVTAREQAIAELKRSNAELEQFSYAISHDMRQPLRMISSYLQLLENGLGDRLDAEQREFFGFATDGAKRLDAMLVGLLDYSRVGRKGEPPARVNSRALLDQALRFLQPALTEARAGLHIEGDWPAVFVSPDELVRLLQNLIGNAIKFRVAGRQPEIALASEMAGKAWRVSITDNGIGIIPDQIERLFQVFQRLHSRADYEGSGIGLALCRKIVERHGGRIWAESAGEGRGSRFTFEMPAGESS